MNRNNAVFLVSFPDAVIVDVSFDPVPVSRLSPVQQTSTYTYCARASWLEGFGTGDVVIVPVNDKGNLVLKLARLVDTRGIEELDLDNDTIEYKWIVGFLSDDLMERYEHANRTNAIVLSRANQARAKAIREAAAAALYLESPNETV